MLFDRLVDRRREQLVDELLLITADQLIVVSRYDSAAILVLGHVDDVDLRNLTNTVHVQLHDVVGHLFVIDDRDADHLLIVRLEYVERIKFWQVLLLPFPDRPLIAQSNNSD